MSRGLNKVMAIGHLGADPETRYVPSGAAVTTFSIAVTESWKDKTTEEIKERTEWIRCEVWGKSAEACAQYLRKGSQTFVEGRLRTDSWEDDAGQKRTQTKVRCDNVVFLGSGGKRDESAPRTQAPSAPTPQTEFDDDIPF